MEFPHEVLSEEGLDAWRSNHAVVLNRCRDLSQSMSGVPTDGDLIRAFAEELRVCEAESSWYEDLLCGLQPVEESSAVVRSLQMDVPLNESGPSAPEQFLQTRTVSLEEARGELGEWLEPAREEVVALELTTQAVERISAREVEDMVRCGRKVLQVPGKAVLTRKSGVGRRRFRAVCCGNFLPSLEMGTSRAELYAGGVDSLTVRVVLAYTAQFPSWVLCVLDIKTAFLYAPVRGSTEEDSGEAPVIVVKPPYMLVQLQLLKGSDRWKVRRALYGLATSPRDWADYRDSVLRKVEVAAPIGAKLFQSNTDESMWFLKDSEGVLHAVLIVYVDDLGVFAEEPIAAALVAAIRAQWKTSEPSWTKEEERVTFCGLEISKNCRGWRVDQSKYLRELLNRYQVVETASCPLSKWEDPELETPSTEEVKDAQGITGALLWAVTRSRPDLSFTVGKMSQYTTKAPVKVKEMGLQALRYVASTLSLGMEYPYETGPEFGNEGQLSVARSVGSLEIYADASHAPGGGRSTQGIIVAWRSALIFWESTKQPFVTLSSAEAELVAMIAAVQVGESITPVIEELTQTDISISLLGDNQAALTSFGPGIGSWRNRHLRMRAAAARERISAGVLSATYVPGDLQVADVGTKPLGTSRALALLSIVNVSMLASAVPGPMAAKFFGNLSSLQISGAATVSPATLVVLALLMSAPVGQAFRPEKPAWTALCVTEGVVFATAQPATHYEQVQGWMFWIVAVVFFLVWAIFRWGRGQVQAVPEIADPEVSEEDNGESRGILCEQVSPRLRQTEAAPSSQSGAVERVARGGEGPPNEAGPEAGSCVFPMVGRVDYRSNWVPAHFFRYLLSVVGGPIVLFVDPYSVEIWRIRALGRTFRYGVASAYEKAIGPLGVRGGQVRGHDLPQVYTFAAQSLPSQAEGADEFDDPTVDQVRHVPPEEYEGPPVQDVRLNRFEESDSSNTGESSSTTASNLSTGSQSPERGESEGVDSAADLSGFSERPPVVANRAVDGALIVVHLDDELRVPLPGWSMEEVGSIVQSIQQGDWRSFYEVMSWSQPSVVDSSTSPVRSENLGLADGEMAYGLDQTTEGPHTQWGGASSSSGAGLAPIVEPEVSGDVELSPEPEMLVLSSVGVVVTHLGSGVWVFGCSLSALGGCSLCSFLYQGLRSFCEGVPPGEYEGCFPLTFRPVELETGGSHGLGSLVSAVVAVWFLGLSYRMGYLLAGSYVRPPRLVLCLPGAPGLTEIPLDGSVGWAVWIFMVVIFGLCHPAEAYSSHEHALSVDFVDSSGQCPELGLTSGIGCFGVEDYGATGWVLAWLIQAVAVVFLWEAFKFVCRLGRSFKTAESQTEMVDQFPLPLPDGVPNRAQILYCLWRAGYTTSIEQYPPEVQEEYFGLLGSWLQRARDDEESSG